MAQEFIGLDMLVTLLSPPGAQLRGKVHSVVAGQSLTLHNVYCPNNGQVISDITIRATDIQDLVQAVNPNQIPTFATPPPPPPVPIHGQYNHPPALLSRQFEDPAILSMRRRPTIPTTVPLRPTHSSPSPAAHQEPISILFNPDNRHVSATIVKTSASPVAGSTASRKASSAVPVAPVAALSIDDEKPIIQDEQVLIPQVKKSRPTRKSRAQKEKTARATTRPAQVLPVVVEIDKANGWRQTPLLEPNPSFQPFAALYGKPRGKQEDSGWATEDATDVQELGEFDFATNLGKFDKTSLFDSMKARDKTADEDRLVGHNRLARPGTNGGKNFHALENVLDSTNGKEAWNSEADDHAVSRDGQRGSQRDTGSGRNSRHGQSQLRRPVSRKESGGDSLLSLRHLPVSNNGFRGAFYTKLENKRCDTISALQMLNLENIADSEFGLTEDMMTENAGRSIADLALSMTSRKVMLDDPESVDRKTSAVILAGDNKSGLRAVAAGRHLRNHGMSVVVCVLGLSRESDLLIGLRRQLKVFRSFGGKVFTKIQLMDFLKASPCDLIVDGLLGLTMAFEELGTGDQATAYELIEWANRSGAEVMAIDIPTGIDPSSGKVSIIDGRPLYIHPTLVVAMGAAKKGLMQAMILGEGVGEGVEGSEAWRIWVADIGIASLAWKKAGTKMRRGMEFEKSWTFEIGFKAGAE